MEKEDRRRKRTFVWDGTCVGQKEKQRSESRIAFPFSRSLWSFPSRSERMESVRDDVGCRRMCAPGRTDAWTSFRRARRSSATSRLEKHTTSIPSGSDLARERHEIVPIRNVFPFVIFFPCRNEISTSCDEEQTLVDEETLGVVPSSPIPSFLDPKDDADETIPRREKQGSTTSEE